MTSSMQARESLGSLSELITPMLGEEAAAIGAHAPDASPEDKLADDIKKVIAEESAKIRYTSMTEAKLKAEQFHTEHTLTWMPPEEFHGVSRDGGGGGGPALCNRLTPCFCWHGCLRMPGSTQTEEPGCPTTTHIWVRRCRLGRTVGRYAFSSHQARAHAFSRPAACAHASCM